MQAEPHAYTCLYLVLTTDSVKACRYGGASLLLLLLPFRHAARLLRLCARVCAHVSTRHKCDGTQPSHPSKAI